MTLEIRRSETIDEIDIRYLTDGSVEAQYQGKTCWCRDGFVHCAVARVMYWNEMGRTMDREQCINDPEE